jgi:dipeptidase E
MVRVSDGADADDMPITWPTRPDALGPVPLQVNPHSFSGPTFVRVGGGYREHLGQTRDDRIREFHEMNDRAVVGLWAGGLPRIEGGEMLPLGARARILRKRQGSEDVEPGRRQDALPGG